MPEITSDTTVARRPTALLLLAGGLVWLVLAAALIVIAAQYSVGAATSDWRSIGVTVGAFALQLLPPIAVVVLAWAMVRRTADREPVELAVVDTRVGAHDVARTLATELDGLDAMLDRIAGRLGALRDTAASDALALGDTAARLDTSAAGLADSARRANEAGAALAAALPDGERRAADVANMLGTNAGEIVRQLREIETMLAALWSASDDGAARHESSVMQLEAGLKALTVAADATADRVGRQAVVLHDAVTNALDGTTGAIDTTRAGVEAQTAALLASVDQARVAMDHIGGEASRAIQQRLEVVLAAADTLGTRLGEEDARAKRFVETVERSFTVLDAKLANAAGTGNATLDAMQDRLHNVRDTAHRLSEPLDATHGALTEIEAVVGRLGGSATAALQTLGIDIPASAEGVQALAASVARVRTDLDAVAAPVQLVDENIARVLAQLGSARELAEGVETTTGTAALNASSQLIEVLGRVREVANATAGSMRDALVEVVAEAEAALAQAGTRAAFATPVEAQVARLDAASTAAADAAQAAAERITQRLVALTGTVGSVEARISEVDARYAVVIREDIAKRSDALIGSLNTAAIDLTQLLQLDVGDTTWASYLKGDRSIFARRAVKLLDTGTARRVAAHYEHDEAFRAQATRFIGEFEGLLKRVMLDREGETMAVTLLSSDIGKLYVGLSQATERLRA